MPRTPLTYDFVSPSRVVFGWGRRAEVGILGRALGKRAFVICGSRTLEKNDQFIEICKSLNGVGIEPLRVGRIGREPLVEDVDRTVAEMRELQAGRGDFVIGIGGGSAIDVAKAAAALVTNERVDSVREFLEGVGSGRKIVAAPIPVLAMPTTAGTGSEATKNAVISSLNPPFKKSLRSELMVPRVVLLDPELAVSVPPHVTAWTGMDALTQCVESYVSKRKTPLARGYAAEGMRLVTTSIVEAYRNGTSCWARERMAQAALFSGIALANSGLGMAHGVAAALGVHCHVAHGLACAVMLPATLRANARGGIDDWDQRMLAVWLTTGISEPENSVARKVLEGGFRFERVIEKIEELLSDLNIPRRLSQIGVKPEQIPAIVRDSRGNSMSGNPREISDEELTRILEEML